MERRRRWEYGKKEMMGRRRLEEGEDGKSEKMGRKQRWKEVEDRKKEKMERRRFRLFLLIKTNHL